MLNFELSSNSTLWVNHVNPHFFKMEINTVFNEDCLIGMKRIPDKSIDMILCDLPYGTTACKWDVIIPFEPLWEQYERIIKDKGAIVLTASQPFTTDLINSNRKLFRYEMIWSKGRGFEPQLANIRPMKAHENVCIFYKSKPTYNPQKTPCKPFKSNGCGNAKSKENHSLMASQKLPTKIVDSKFPISIIESGFERGLHPTQKPVALFEYLIKTYTNEGETVLDNCAGSGTTAIACLNLNRNYILFEKEEKYFNIIQERIKNHTVQLKLIA